MLGHMKKLLVAPWKLLSLTLTFVIVREGVVGPLIGSSASPTFRLMVLGLSYFLLIAMVLLVVSSLVNHLREEKDTEIDLLERQISFGSKLKDVGLMTAGMAHNFKNYLGILEQTCKMIGDIENSNQMVDKALRLQSSCLYQARGVVNQMLSFAKKEVHEKGRPRPIVEILEDAISLAELLVKDRRIKLHKDFQVQSDELRVDDVALMQSIINLVKNSAEASEPGSTVIVSTEMEFVKDGAVYAVTVKDEGSGMSQEQLSRLFDPFGSTKGNGTGLGLLTVKRLVEGDGGKVKVKSELGHGTEIKLCFPIAAAT